MTTDRWLRVSSAFADGPADGDGDGDGDGKQPRRPKRPLCVIVCEVLDVAGAAVSLTSGPHRSLLCASGQAAVALEDLQFTSGQGPSIDACAGQYVAEPRLSEAGGRWPAFAAAAAAMGVGAVFGYPLRLGAARLGALTLYAPKAESLEGSVAADADAVADIVTLRVLAMQAAASGTEELADGLADAALHRAEVHQASGMLSVQLGVGIGEALIRLRAFAYASGRPAAAVASDVIDGRLRIS